MVSMKYRSRPPPWTLPAIGGGVDTRDTSDKQQGIQTTDGIEHRDAARTCGLITVPTPLHAHVDDVSCKVLAARAHGLPGMPAAVRASLETADVRCGTPAR